MNTTVRTRKDVEDAVSIPFLGEIPLRDKKNKDEIVVRENGRDSISEAFRIVRTNMDFMRVKAKDMKVVMFTSFNPNAGKTFVSMNLAMSFALTRKKVILVDLDIRKGTPVSYTHLFMVGANYLPEQMLPDFWDYNSGNYFLNVTFLPCLEVGYRCTLMKLKTGKWNQDRSVSLRIRPVCLLYTSRCV